MNKYIKLFEDFKDDNIIKNIYNTLKIDKKVYLDVQMYDDDTIYLDQIVISKNHRNKGLFKKTINGLKNIADKHNLGILLYPDADLELDVISDDDLINLYKKFGFKFHPTMKDFLYYKK
tara:strand:- start:23377 stop:23733 length:357 start_codon:yes stop_codon:yes gene_type:complete